jgi:hypothetical protein
MKNIQFVYAKQAKTTDLFMNIKRKRLLINANIWFNKQAVYHKVIPNYEKIKVAGNSPSGVKTQKLATNIRI